ncbi:MAG: xanthine dehydrogenase family protein subunit M [Dehalococcoidales bacterium]|jgi:xanthine dehydrogenase YagS FAD-binding subunit
MNNFEHADATTIADAISLLASNGSSVPIAGGTDLLTQIKLGLIKPGRLVNLKTIPGLDLITVVNNGLNIGALANLDTIANNSVVRVQYPALIKAIEVTASPQLRNSGTVGGNLAQGPRCWYYRGQFQCWMKGGERCYARNGENSHHAIFGNGRCNQVHPSDLAPVLIALGAEINIEGIRGRRTIPLSDLFQIPHEGSRQLTILDPGEIITMIHLPTPVSGSRSTYFKAMERKVWSFALASVAVQLVIEDGVIRNPVIVLGGVAPKPWRLPKSEESLRNQTINREVITAAAETAVEGAQPLNANHYKIPLVKGILTEVLSDILGLNQ